jgi:hypothetical protein
MPRHVALSVLFVVIGMLNTKVDPIVWTTPRGE